MRNRFAVGCLIIASGCPSSTEIGMYDIADTPAVAWSADSSNPSEEVDASDLNTTTATAATQGDYPDLVATATEQAVRIDPPTTPPTTSPPIVNGPVCTQAEAEAFAHQILDPQGIPVPEIMMSDESYYAVGRPLVSLKECENLSIVTHEIAHYVHSYTYNYDLQAVKDSALAFTSGTWIRGREVFPGIEYVAHCVGNVIFGNSPYTKCPDEDLKAKARAIINLASQK